LSSLNRAGVFLPPVGFLLELLSLLARFLSEKRKTDVSKDAVARHSKTSLVNDFQCDLY
jgi:hypothetical protein